MDYPLSGVIRVETDGPVRIVRLARPEQLNAVNAELHRGADACVSAAQRRPGRPRRRHHR